MSMNLLELLKLPKPCVKCCHVLCILSIEGCCIVMLLLMLFMMTMTVCMHVLFVLLLDLTHDMLVRISAPLLFDNDTRGIHGCTILGTSYRSRPIFLLLLGYRIPIHIHHLLLLIFRFFRNRWFPLKPQRIQQ